jgi:aminobenzoyl-glutamate transport protein
MDEARLTRGRGFTRLRDGARPSCATWPSIASALRPHGLGRSRGGRRHDGLAPVRTPHPASLFVMLAGSWSCSRGSSPTRREVAHPATGEAEVVNLLSVAGAQRLMMGLLPNFINFAPFGPVLVCLLGLSVAEHSGFLGAVVRVIISATPTRLLTLVMVFTGATSSTAGDVGYVLLLPLARRSFTRWGAIRSPDWPPRSPACRAASRPTCCSRPPISFSPGSRRKRRASSIRVRGDADGQLLLSRRVGVSGHDHRHRGDGAGGRAALGAYTGDVVPEPALPLSPAEWRGLRWALLRWCCWRSCCGAWCRPTGSCRIRSARASSARVPARSRVLDLRVRLVPGVVYGVVAGTIRRDRDVYRGMQKNMELIAGYIVVCSSSRSS